MLFALDVGRASLRSWKHIGGSPFFTPPPTSMLPTSCTFGPQPAASATRQRTGKNTALQRNGARGRSASMGPVRDIEAPSGSKAYLERVMRAWVALVVTLAVAFVPVRSSAQVPSPSASTVPPAPQVTPPPPAELTPPPAAPAASAPPFVVPAPGLPAKPGVAISEPTDRPWLKQVYEKVADSVVLI